MHAAPASAAHPAARSAERCCWEHRGLLLQNTTVRLLLADYYHVWCHSPSCGRRYGAYGDWASYLTNWSISILGIAGIIAFANTARYMHRLRQQRKAIKHQQQKQHGIGNNVAVGFPGTGATRPNADGNAAGSQLQDHWSPRDDISRDALQQQKEHATPGSIAKQQALQLAHVGQYQQPPGTNSSVLVSPASTEALPAYPHVPAQHIAPTVPATFNGQIGTPAIVYVTDSPPASPAATGIRNAGGTTTGSTSNGFHGHSSEPDATASAPGCCLSPRSRKAAGGHDASDAVLEVHDGANGGVEGQHDCREELKHKVRPVQTTQSPACTQVCLAAGLAHSAFLHGALTLVGTESSLAGRRCFSLVWWRLCSTCRMSPHAL